MKRKYSALSLFSGAGGMDVGFVKAGFNVLLANDIDKSACETYSLNHKNPILHGDVRSHYERIVAHSDIDLVFGGPPCQGFSVAGKMDPNDERSELLWDFFDIVRETSPKVFVCENVKALAVNRRWEKIRERLFQVTNEMEYETLLIVLDASDFGVPQKRERMFLIGVDKTLNLLTEELSKIIIESIESQKCSPPKIREIVSRLGPAGSTNNSRVCQAIITFAKNPILRKSPYAGMLFNGAGRPINTDGCALTLPASMGGNKTPIIDEEEIFKSERSFVESYHAHLLSGGHPHTGKAPARLRRITIDEALAIQTFPRDYKLAGTNSAKYRQIGNAVPCNLAEVVANSVLSLLSQANS